MSVFSRLPGLQAVRSYRREWLAKDVVAGVVLTTLLVPQGMAYAELAGLPPITGLYTSILCLLGYAVFGPSRILVLGPDSSLGPMIAATILPLMAAGGDAGRAVALASVLAIMVAAVMIVAAVARLGYGLTRTINPHHFFPTIETAITAFRHQTGAEWTAADRAADGQAPPGQSGAGISPPRGTPHHSAG